MILFKAVFPLMSVRLWNFKDGGSKNARVLPKNQHAQRIFFYNNPAMNYRVNHLELIQSKELSGPDVLINLPKTDVQWVPE